MIGEKFDKFRYLAILLQEDPLVANTVCDWLLCKVEAAGKARYLGFGIYWQYGVDVLWGDE
jgi:hypothetical protein